MEFLLGRVQEGGILLLIGPLFVLIGGLLLVATVVKTVRAIGRRSREIHANGTVVDLETRPGRKGGRLFFPRVRFLAADGLDYEITASVGTSFRTKKKGQKVKIRYELDKPEEADIDSVLTNWFEIVVYLFMGGVFTIVGFVMTLMFWLIA